MVVATLVYQPAAAKTGSLLVWTRNRIYVMDIDTLTLERVGPATARQLIAPSPGCFGQADSPCWVLVSDQLYRVDLSVSGDHTLQARLPVGQDLTWNDDAPASWSPDGHHLAYSVFNQQNNQAQLRVYDAGAGAIQYQDDNIDASVPVAWSNGCASDFTASGCQIAYKKMAAHLEGDFLPALIGYTPATQNSQKWPLSTEPIFELRWSLEGELLYSRPKRFFRYAKDHTPAYHLPPGGQLANLSPNAQYMVYYQPFKLEECREGDECLHLGVWLAPASGIGQERRIIYSLDISNSTELAGGLNFIPVWTADSRAFIFFQAGQLIHYDLEKEEATIWYKPVPGKLKSLPVFSPNEEAVAFVDDQGHGHSGYRLVVVNPRLQPVEHIIETDSGFKILAWLPN